MSLRHRRNGHTAVTLAIGIGIGISLLGGAWAADSGTDEPDAETIAVKESQSLFEGELAERFPASHLMYLRLSTAERQQVFEAYLASGDIGQAKVVIPELFKHSEQIAGGL